MIQVIGGIIFFIIGIYMAVLSETENRFISLLGYIILAIGAVFIFFPMFDISV